MRSAQHSIQNKRFTLVNNEELFDLSNDPSETENVIAECPQVVDKFLLYMINGGSGCSRGW